MSEHEEAAGPGHNVGGVAADRLQSIVDRYERLDEEKKALTSDQKDLIQEAASAGFDVKVLRQVLRLRKMDKAERDEMESLLALYLHALGMA